MANWNTSPVPRLAAYSTVPAGFTTRLSVVVPAAIVAVGSSLRRPSDSTRYCPTVPVPRLAT